MKMDDENYDPDKCSTSRSKTKSKCLIHYEGINYSENLIPVNETRFNELLHIKSCREQLGENFIHVDQSSKIPIGYKNDLLYHRECYSNYSRARSEFKKRAPLSEVPSNGVQRTHRSMELDNLGRFPKHCWFCKDSKAKRIRTRGRNIFEPVKLADNGIKKTLVEAARKRDDGTLLCCIEGTDVELHAKGFRKHSSCYIEYTKILYEKESSQETDTAMEKVKEVVQKTVIGDHKCMPLDEILEVKGEVKNSDTRKNLKRWLERNFDDLVFLTVQSNQSQVVVSKDTWEEVTTGMRSLNSSIPVNKSSVLRDAARILQTVVTEYTENAEPLPWPPTVESLQKRLESMPEMLTEFLRVLLSPQDIHHVTSETINRHVSSFAQDIVYSISKGTFLTLKHTCVGLGLHSMTGMKIPLVILSRLGNSISYDTALELETAQAELAEQFDRNGKGLPIQPKSQSSFVPTVFWFDNFDSFVDNNTGAGSIHNTPGVAFQEENEMTVRRPDISKEKTKRRSLPSKIDEPCPKVPRINPKKNPENTKGGSHDSKPVDSWSLLSLWKAARFTCRNDQRYSRYAGFVIKGSKQSKNKTVLTYLPPIERPITDYGTLFEILNRAGRLSAEAKMKYLHIIMDCGAAMKMFQVIFNNPDKFSNVIVHLGDFHFMQAFFDVIGRFVSSSGFEDIVFQLGLRQPGSMNAMIKGKHYNWALLIHEMLVMLVMRNLM